MTHLSIIQNKYNSSNLVNFKSKLTVLNAQNYTNNQKPLANSALKAKADEAARQGFFDKAISLYQRALEYSPDDPDLRLGLAKSYCYNNQFQNAAIHFEKYVSSHPDDLENVTMYGECLKKSGRFSEAISVFNRVLEIEPKYDYAKRNLLDTQNLYKACSNPIEARQERYNTAVNNLTEAVKIAKNFLPKGYMNDMKDVVVSFDKTSQMGGRSNIAQYEHTKRKISVTDDYVYANPKLVGAYLIHEFTHGKDNDPYTSIREEQDAYRVQAKYWVEKVKDVYDPEMDYVADLYRQSAKALDDRVEEIYRLRDPGIAETSFNHPPASKKAAASKLVSDQPLKAYEIIV